MGRTFEKYFQQGHASNFKTGGTLVSLQELWLTTMSVLPVAPMLHFGSSSTEAEGPSWVNGYCLEEAERETE